MLRRDAKCGQLIASAVASSKSSPSKATPQVGLSLLRWSACIRSAIITSIMSASTWSRLGPAGSFMATSWEIFVGASSDITVSRRDCKPFAENCISLR